jgi:diguanylate cyclase (GGDEF)-like protein/PAS domain S-box-containing protein
VHPDDVAEVDRVVDEAYARAGAGSLVHRIIRPDGAVRTIDARFRFESDPGGRVVRVHGTCQDITAIKVAEERFRSLFENAPYPMLVIDPAAGGRVSLSNLRAQEILGVSREELHGRPISDFVAGGENGHEPWYADGGPEGDGELSARRRDGSTFPVEVSLTPLDSEDGGLVSVAIRDVTADRAAAASLSHQARHDALTGLPNRVLFLERLERALARARRSGRPLAVIFLDLDDFKLVNDTRGHEVGDALLMALTPRLNAAVRYGDTIARLGGDEFVALCEDLGGDSDALEIAERLTSAAREPVWAGDLEHHVSISAGIVMVIDPESVTAQAVLRDSDAAMYAAKANGKGRVAMFDESMRERLMERVAIEASLRGAVDRGELELYYQPVVGLDHGRVVAVEALLRWHHPVRGLLGAAEFMPVAERSGLTGAIGEWVIDQACRQAVSWRGAVPVSVNVSAHQLTRSDLPATVARVLKDTGLEPRMLMLEVTEGTLLQDAAEPALRRLKALGVRIVVDDFGTGYSSVAALRGLGVDGLKLDRSFVHALGREGEDGSVVGAILGVAGALDADVMAEGVETWAQATRLRMHGCALAQGYLFARPCPATELSALLASAGRSGHAAPLAL